MANRRPWLLPDGVDELLPPHARALEELQRALLDVFERWGYELVQPPVVEYLESLLSGNGEDLDLQTVKLTDQVSGRLMGVRADITPQAARIDAHRLASDAPRRLCYAGPVLHARPDRFAGSRNPLQLGAELYGHAGIESDVEIITLLLEVLAAAEIPPVTLELGHMGLFHAICEHAHLDTALESDVLDLLLMKDVTELAATLDASGVDDRVAGHLLALTELNGGEDVLARARSALAGAPASVTAALDDVERLTALVRTRVPAADLHLDFAELRGYSYHTGVTFAAYTADHGRAIAWGGRYDNIGNAFGRARPATGFSTDLKLIASLRRDDVPRLPRIFAPAGSEPALLEAIRTYRAAGYTVVQELPGQQGGAAAAGCEQRLTNAQGDWQVEDVEDGA